MLMAFVSIACHNVDLLNMPESLELPWQPTSRYNNWYCGPTNAKRTLLEK